MTSNWVRWLLLLTPAVFPVLCLQITENSTKANSTKANSTKAIPPADLLKLQEMSLSVPGMHKFWQYIATIFEHPFYLDPKFAQLSQKDKHDKLLDIFLRRVPCELEDRHSIVMTSCVALLTNTFSTLDSSGHTAPFHCIPHDDELSQYLRDIDDYGKFLLGMMATLQYLSTSGSALQPTDRTCDIDGLVLRANTIGADLSTACETYHMEDGKRDLILLQEINENMTAVGQAILSEQHRNKSLANESLVPPR